MAVASGKTTQGQNISMGITLDELLQIVDNSNIKSFRGILQQIICIISDPHATVIDLKDVIDMDPPLTANILRRANSSFYGQRRTVTEILDAIVIMGLDEIQELALNQKMWELFESGNGKNNGYSRLSLWVHCVGVALCGKLLYRRELGKRGGDVYTAGLLHDIGIIIEDQFLKEDFARITKLVTSGGVNQHEAEKEIIGFCHEDLAKRLLELWDVPDAICRSVGTAERLGYADAEYTVMSDVLYVSNCACQDRRIGYIEIPRTDRLAYGQCLERLGFRESAINVVMDEVERCIQLMNDDRWFF